MSNIVMTGKEGGLLEASALKNKERNGSAAASVRIGVENASEIVISGERGYLIAKRALDIVASFCAIVVLLLPMLVVYALVWAESPGPAIFKQERLGKDGKPFMMYKFRSMRVDAEANGPQWAKKDDDRCTHLGHILRKFRIDELPQLWNILVGEMSIVGPRPERRHFYDEFETYIPGFRNRLLVQPGLTGLAQINGGYDLPPEEKIVYDMEYIRTRTFWLDVKCIFQTVALVFTHKGAR